MAAGLDDDLFWRSTPAEAADVLEVLAERRQASERQAARRAGLVASAIYNVHRKKGKRPLGPDDFVETKEPKRMTHEEFKSQMMAWAKSVNARRES